jgi:hypothetical protein
LSFISIPLDPSQNAIKAGRDLTSHSTKCGSMGKPGLRRVTDPDLAMQRLSSLVAIRIGLYDSGHDTLVDASRLITI